MQVAERTLFLWNNEHIVNLIAQNRTVVLPIIFEALEKNIQSHWNQAVHGLTVNVQKMFIEMDAELFEECQRQYAEREAKAKDLEEIMQLKSAGTNTKESAWRLCSVGQVEQVKILLSVIPIFSCTIVFNTILAQPQTFSVQQGRAMDTHLTKSFNIPPASLQAGLAEATAVSFVGGGSLRTRRRGKGYPFLQRVGRLGGRWKEETRERKGEKVVFIQDKIIKLTPSHAS
ncbi:hypothetical protein LR48_Vigan09g243700 [Vigna angularis]|uniref:Serine/threonine protein phosphatase 2A regulatory subunit n=1 Tax=Phaseolus angularis TaxID=3914 RepID=A0A0L9VFJ6_PHAAN|nr:hypothetical protein LR48_Vigan09g243700 [Vigna angularis]